MEEISRGSTHESAGFSYSGLPEDLFVGRTAELPILSTRITRAINGTGSACFVFGEPGVGKSRLISEAFRNSKVDENTVIASRCRPEASKIAFHVWADLLRVYGQLNGWQKAENAAGGYADLLAQFEPELLTMSAPETTVDSTDPVAGTASDHSWRRALEAFRFFFISASKSEPLILWIEDLQFADRWTLDLIRVICADIHRTAMCLLCEMRGPIPSGTNDDIATISDVLRRHGSVESIYLEALPIGETRLLAEQWLGNVMNDQSATRLQRRTGGNPLFLTQLLRSSGEFDLEIEAPASATPTANIRALVASRITGLTSHTYRVLCAAALIGYEFDTTLLCAPPMRWEDEAEPLAAIELLTRLGIFKPADNPGCYRFIHGLVREAVIADMPPRTGGELNLRIADTLERIHRNNFDTVAHAAYRHLLASGSGDVDRLALLAYRAGINAFNRYAHVEAQRLLNECLSHLDAEGDETLRAKCHRGLAMASVHAEEEIYWAVKSSHHFLEALRLFLRSGDSETLRSFIREPEISRLLLYGKFGDVKPFEALVKALPQDARAELFQGRAVLTGTKQQTSARKIFIHARLLAVQYGDPHTELQACIILGWHYFLTGDFEEAYEPVRKAIELSRELGDIFGEDEARRCMMDLLRKNHEVEELKVSVRDYSQWARATNDPEILARVLGFSELKLAIGELNWEKAKSIIREYESIAHTTGNYLRVLVLDIATANIAVNTGDQVGIRRFVEFVATRKGNHNFHNIIELLIHLVILTDNVEYIDLLERKCSQRLMAAGSSANPMIEWSAYSGLGITSALRGDRVGAKRYQRLIPEEKADSGWGRTGAIANLTGDHEDAIFRLSKHLEEERTSRSGLLLSRIILADSILATGNPALRERGIAELTGALSIATEHGMPLYEGFARKQGHRHGVKLVTRESDRETKRVCGLTERETDVLRLVEAGMLNKEIASKLGISVRTVHRHVENILRKTGCGNRTEAAIYAVTHGLT
jgi:DNA-binding CsgD family transcriptional regulator/tetratricopeptide (TPR) repeat protein